MGTDEIRTSAVPRAVLPDHPLRVALLDLLAEHGSLTATEAADRLGHSSGLCSFHLRQLARHGLIEEAPHGGGRARPWRLRWEAPAVAGPGSLPPVEAVRPAPAAGEPAEPTRSGPAGDTFSAVLRLTPGDADELATALGELVASYADRGGRRGTVPFAAAYWLAPLPTR